MAANFVCEQFSDPASWFSPAFKKKMWLIELLRVTTDELLRQ